ncbi:chorismate mutase [Pseudomonas sp. PCH199]|uniref:chorismate mutase n=1 Tax=unclassified Pseudomonas TaxID=196821 RepID=UPI000BCD4131|nr:MULTISPECIES: chorismate mutase [unclassified Pseudomonas]MCW8278853.1 chorismate mutase [Pseudomonas sp. PCH199]PAM80961.1 chorismate mutase [Pseudomonas sp. ERMR1:02]
MFHCPRLPLLLTCALCSLLAGVAHAATPSPAPDSLQPLLSTINERLNMADEVALSKWDSGKPIQDTAREALVIANARTQAVKHKLDPEEAAELVAAQIEANKLVQYGLIALWQAAHKAPDVPRPDLNQLRPKLDELQTRLLQQYADFEPYRHDPQCPIWLAEQRSSLIKDALHGQALIRATGELCVTKQ